MNLLFLNKETAIKKIIKTLCYKYYYKRPLKLIWKVIYKLEKMNF